MKLTKTTTATMAEITAADEARDDAASSQVQLGRLFMERYRQVFKALAQEDLRGEDLES